MAVVGGHILTSPPGDGVGVLFFGEPLKLFLEVCHFLAEEVKYFVGFGGIG